MTTNQCDIGLIGLAVMGENLVLNMESKGFSVAAFNRTTEVTEKFAANRAQGKNIQPTKTMGEFVGALKRPRKAMIMVKAGAPVDAVIGQLAPLVEKGDVIIDGGNSLFTDTQRRCKDLEGRGIHFVGCGVSGGEEGALKGPSLMPGGSRESWEIIAPIFRKIAAQVDGEPCCRYMGPDGAGHYVKMVHNGIEYGDMQLICEAYAILKDVVNMNVKELAETFTEWNKGELDSYLIDITSQIFRKIDPETGRVLATIPSPGGGRDSGLAWAEGTLWVGQYRDRKIHQIDAETGAILRTLECSRFVTGVTWVDGELWHGTWEGDESDLRRIDPRTGEVLESLEMPRGAGISGLESDGGDRFFCGGGKSGKVRTVRRPKRGPAMG